MSDDPSNNAFPHEVHDIPDINCNEPPKKQSKLTDTPRKQKLKKNLGVLRTRIWRAKQKLNSPNTGSVKKGASNITYVCSLVETVLPKQTADFIKSQIKINATKSKKGYRWSLRDKMFALSIFYHSRKVYALLRKLFIMPSKTTLLKMLQKTNIYPGFSTNVFDALQRKVSTMTESNRQCVLVFDEMSIKTHLSYNRHHDCIEGFTDLGSLGKTKFVANHAIAFMVRGIASKWKQSIGYFLSSGPTPGAKLKLLVEEAIDKLSAIGLKVRVVICDQGSNNRNFMETLAGVNEQKPYFTHNTQKIYAMYDPPHLLKNVRNNLKKHGFCYEDKPVKWQFIEDFYDFDKENKIRLAPKLTDMHINTPAFSTMSVPLAAQVLSHTTAAGIYTLCQLKKLPEEAETTAMFLDKMDKIFNAMNSQSLKSSQPYGHAMSASTDHVRFLKESIDFFNNLKLSKPTTIYCIRGWKISINAVLGLWEDLHRDNSFSYLLTNRLNQDCAENLFSTIRGKGGHRVNPTATEFRAAYRQAVFDQILEQSAGSNCSADMDQILLSLTNITGDSPSSTQTSTSGDNGDEPALSDASSQDPSPMPSTSQDAFSTPATSQEPSSNATTSQEPSSNPVTAAHNPSPNPVTLQDPVSTPVPSQDPSPNEKLAGLEYLLLMKAPTSLPEQNIEAYMAGYLLRKSRIGTCDDCHKQLIHKTLPDSDLYVFLRKKGIPAGRHAYPTEVFIEFVENLENVFVKVFDTVKYMNSILVRLCKNSEDIGKHFLKCKSLQCNTKLYAMIKLYLKVRMFHALKTSNLENKNKKGVKRNRKLLNLQHK